MRPSGIIPPGMTSSICGLRWLDRESSLTFLQNVFEVDLGNGARTRLTYQFGFLMTGLDDTFVGVNDLLLFLGRNDRSLEFGEARPQQRASEQCVYQCPARLELSPRILILIELVLGLRWNPSLLSSRRLKWFDNCGKVEVQCTQAVQYSRCQDLYVYQLRPGYSDRTLRSKVETGLSDILYG